MSYRSDDLRLHSDDEGAQTRFIISDISLVVTRASVRPEVLESINAEFDRIGHINYYSRSLKLLGPGHVQVCLYFKKLILQPGAANWESVISRSVCPQMLFVVLTYSASSEGLRGKSPFNFYHHGLTSARANFEGKNHPNAEGWKMDFAGAGTRKPLDHDYTSIYNQLLRCCGSLDSNSTSVDISEDAFRSGSTIISFQFDLNTVNPEYTSYSSTPGLLSLHLKFRAPIEAPVSVFCFELQNENCYLHPDGVIIST